MDVNQVLQGTLSGDTSIRSAAEQQLSQAAEADFPGYLTTLAQELGNEQANSAVRQAAALALKNAFTARDFQRLRDVQEKWLQQLDPQIKLGVKSIALKTLASSDTRAGQASAQLIASIAAIEIPRNQWEELMPTLVKYVGEGTDYQKQASLVAIGYICDSDDEDLRRALHGHSNAILTAVVQGARKEEPNNDVRNSAITALGDSLEFVRSNFENEGERNYIMQVICEATQAQDERVQQGAYGCLNRIMGIYYDKMRFYMEKALFGLTIQGMKNEEEDVAKLAIEFWCTVCEEEIAIDDDNLQVNYPSHQFSRTGRERSRRELRQTQSQSEGSTELRDHHNFARVATQEVVPVLLELLAKQDEDASDDEYNVSRASYQCLSLYAQAVSNSILPPVVNFLEKHLRSEDWHYRDAAVSAFGAIMEGPDDKTLEPLVKQAMPILIAMMSDQSLQVKDSAAYALGRVCDVCSDAIEPTAQLEQIISALFQGLTSHPKMAASCCWALMNLADRFCGEPGCQENSLSPHFKNSIQALLQVTERQDADNQLRTAAYEVLSTFVLNAANDSLQAVASLTEIVLQRLSQTIPMQQQVVSVEDKLSLEEMQTSLTSVVMAIVQRLEDKVEPQADRIMALLLQLLGSAGGKSTVPESVFAAVSALANAIEGSFHKYMEAFVPFLFNALGNQDEPSICAMAIGLVSDCSRAVGEKIQPHCDAFMNYLLNNLRSMSLGNQFKPAILQCFGDIAQAIGGHFETYLSVVGQVLQQAANINAPQEQASMEMIEYVISLREGIMDAWGGIVQAMKLGGKPAALSPYIEPIFALLHSIAAENNRSDVLMRSSMGVIGDISEAFPGGEYGSFFRPDWVTHFTRDVRANKEFSDRTRDTARWAREQVRQQLGRYQFLHDLYGKLQRLKDIMDASSSDQEHD
ncbi:MAG: karyopherin beta [Bathelium mastoideum]|nr:MAG: karyopherin beta [Bathelium mastoideum]